MNSEAAPPCYRMLFHGSQETSCHLSRQLRWFHGYKSQFPGRSPSSPRAIRMLFHGSQDASMPPSRQWYGGLHRYHEPHPRGPRTHTPAPPCYPDVVYGSQDSIDATFLGNGTAVCITEATFPRAAQLHLRAIRCCAMAATIASIPPCLCHPTL